MPEQVPLSDIEIVRAEILCERKSRLHSRMESDLLNQMPKIGITYSVCQGALSCVIADLADLSQISIVVDARLVDGDQIVPGFLDFHGNSLPDVLDDICTRCAMAWQIDDGSLIVVTTIEQQRHWGEWKREVAQRLETQENIDSRLAQSIVTWPSGKYSVRTALEIIAHQLEWKSTIDPLVSSEFEFEFSGGTGSLLEFLELLSRHQSVLCTRRNSQVWFMTSN